jgi:intein/homing endonuclease
MKITPEVAELFGVYVGDGTMSFNNCTKRSKKILLSISASYDEKEWLNHVVNLFERVFLHAPNVLWNSNVYKIQIGVNRICEFFIKAGFPVGEKSLIVRVPSTIIETNDDVIYKAFLRGYFDADGCISFERNPREKYGEFKKTHHYYPRVTLSSVSKDLITNDVKQILKTLGFRFFIREWIPRKVREHKNYVVTVSGVKQLNYWIEKVGTSNPVNFSKYRVWKKFGFCPPRTALKQRKTMLSGELNPEIFYRK